MRGRRPSGTGGRPALRGLLFPGIHLLVLSSFALAQPLFDLLSKNVVFFAARGSTRWDIVVFALVVTFVPPLALLLVEALVGLSGMRARYVAHLVLVAVLAALVALQALGRIDGADAWLLVAAGLALGALAALVYARFPAFRSILSVLAPAPFVFLGLFLLVSPVSKITLVREAAAASVPVESRTPVVMIVFDEFPSISLMGADGEIDAARYPGFAALAGGATWFRNATTVQGNTSLAVPAILSGDYPRDASRVPILSDYPHNLFTLLGGGYRMNVTESVTRLCPERLCPQAGGEPFGGRLESLISDLGVVYLHMVAPGELRSRLPAIDKSWGNFRGKEGQGKRDQAVRQGLQRGFLQQRLFPASVQDRDLKFRLFTESIRPSRRPSLNFLHVLLPHYGWVYLPSGKRYANALAIPGLVDDTWGPDAYLADQAWQRHLLQVEFTDRLVGELVRHLKEQGLYDRSLIVLTADHGVSFRPGGPRRVTTSENLPDLAFVPLFVKAPGQQEGRIFDEHVQTIDILPTIADLLDVRLPWAVEGHSALAPGYRPSPTVRIFRTAGGSVAESFVSATRRRDALLAEETRLFGSGDAAPGLYGLGPHPELVGRRADAFSVSAQTGLRVELDQGSELVYDPDSETTPARVTGTVRGPGAAAGIALAVAVNGRIEAVTQTYDRHGDAALSVMVPEASLRPGRNTVHLLEVEAGPGGLSLTRLSS